MSAMRDRPRKARRKTSAMGNADPSGVKTHAARPIVLSTATTAGNRSRRGSQGNASPDVGAFVQRIARSTPIELVEIEREGVRGSFVKDLSRRLAIPTSRMFGIL